MMITKILAVLITIIIAVMIPQVLYRIEHDKKLLYITTAIMLFGMVPAILYTCSKAGIINIQEIEYTIITKIPNVKIFATQADLENKILNDKLEIENYLFKISDDSGVIFFGDSRTNGMNIHCNISDKPNQYVVAKDGATYQWMISTGIDKVYEVINDNPHRKWTIISLFGVNDPKNINKYIDFYENLRDEGYNIVLVTVNPTAGHTSVTNDTIKDFNDELFKTDFPIIDTYKVLMVNNFKTVDGVHYTKETYELIYDTILENFRIDGGYNYDSEKY